MAVMYDRHTIMSSSALNHAAVSLSPEEIRARVDTDILRGLGSTLADALPDERLTAPALRAVARFPESSVAPDAVVSLSRPDGSELELRLHGDTSADAALLWIHGGGLILGSAAAEDGASAQRSAALGVAVVTPDYRLAPEHPYPAAFEDCLRALEWAATRFRRVVIAGVSAGGGLAAAVALRCRDGGGPTISALHLYSPMLDDRGVTPSSSLLARTVVWNRRLNDFAWSCYLGDVDPDDRSVPGRAVDLAGLPPTYIDVGELDLFRDEDLEFVQRIAAGGGRIEFHLDRGAVHGFDTRVPDAPISRAVRARRLSALATAFEQA